METQGIMPDILHIMDLAIAGDCILSALLEWSEPHLVSKLASIMI